MENLQNIIDNLFINLDQIELEFYKSGLSNYHLCLEYECDGLIQTRTEYIEKVDDKGFDYQEEETIYLYNCDDRANEVCETIKKILNDKKDLEETLSQLRHIDIGYDLSHLFNFDLLTLRLQFQNNILLLHGVEKNNVRLNQIQEIKSKDKIDVKEFELLFRYGKEAQQKFRAEYIKSKTGERILNPYPLPTVSKKGFKVYYDLKEAEEWINTRHLYSF